MFFRRTHTLWAVEWREWRDDRWQNRRSDWMDIDKASIMAAGLRDAHPDKHIHTVRTINRPVGRVDFTHAV